MSTTLSSTQFSMRIDTSVKHQLEQYSNRVDRSQSYIAARALEEYLARHQARFDAMQAGKKAISEGHYTTQQQTENWLNAWANGDTPQKPQIK